MQLLTFQLKFGSQLFNQVSITFNYYGNTMFSKAIGNDRPIDSCSRGSDFWPSEFCQSKVLGSSTGTAALSTGLQTFSWLSRKSAIEIREFLSLSGLNVRLLFLELFSLSLHLMSSFIRGNPGTQGLSQYLWPPIITTFFSLSFAKFQFLISFIINLIILKFV